MKTISELSRHLVKVAMSQNDIPLPYLSVEIMVNKATFITWGPLSSWYDEYIAAFNKGKEIG